MPRPAPAAPPTPPPRRAAPRRCAAGPAAPPELVRRAAQADYNCYLCYIFNTMKQEPGPVRQMAGLVLKNNLKEHWASLAPEVQDYVRENLLGSVGDPEAYIRTTAGSCITTITYAAGLSAWPALVPTLYRMLDSPDMHSVDGAFSALAKVCEDSAEKLAADTEVKPLDYLIPKFITFFTHAHEPFRKYAVACVNYFVLLLPEPLKQSMDAYLAGLNALTADPSAEVRKRVCQALVMLLDVQLERIAPHLPQIIEYMLQARQRSDARLRPPMLRRGVACAGDDGRRRARRARGVRVLVGDLRDARGEGSPRRLPATSGARAAQGDGVHRGGHTRDGR